MSHADKVIEAVKAMTPEERVQSLISAGIIREDGTLMPQYGGTSTSGDIPTPETDAAHKHYRYRSRVTGLVYENQGKTGEGREVSQLFAAMRNSNAMTDAELEQLADETLNEAIDAAMSNQEKQ